MATLIVIFRLMSMQIKSKMINFSLPLIRLKEQRLFQPAGVYTKQWSGDIVVIGNCLSPTMEFYFRSRRNEVRNYSEFHINSNEKLQDVISIGCAVILVRDTPLSILEKLLLYKKDISDVVWFIDDDIPGASGDSSLPVAYKKRLSGWYRKAKPYLASLCSKVSVSTEWLASKYNLSKSSVLSPLDPEIKQQSVIRCFYHGSSSHAQDWDFVVEVAQKVQTRNSNISFEFIGDHALYKRCKNIARVQILHPMQWQDYLSLTGSRTMDIGLAPLLDNPFNKARSHTKFLDICRQGAVGIYSSSFPLSTEIKGFNAGLVLPNNPDSWVVGIEQLALANLDPMRVGAESLKRELVKDSGTFEAII